MQNHGPGPRMGGAHGSDSLALLFLIEMPSLTAMQMLKSGYKHSEIEARNERKIFSHVAYSR